MKRESRLGDARRTVSQWESLLGQATDLLDDTESLGRKVRDATESIDRTWDETSREIGDVQSDVSDTIERQASDRETDAAFDQSDAADPPRSVPEVEGVHGDPHLPDVPDYEIPDPVHEAEVRDELRAIESEPAVERERPTPFTEQEWFALHSEQYPIGEDVFEVEAGRRAVEDVDEEPEERVRERDVTDRRDTDQREEKR